MFPLCARNGNAPEERSRAPIRKGGIFLLTRRGRAAKNAVVKDSEAGMPTLSDKSQALSAAQVRG
jgi:hypothetical protein